jgi:hypothetical protein
MMNVKKANHRLHHLQKQWIPEIGSAFARSIPCSLIVDSVASAINSWTFPSLLTPTRY